MEVLCGKSLPGLPLQEVYLGAGIDIVSNHLLKVGLVRLIFHGRKLTSGSALHCPTRTLVPHKICRILVFLPAPSVS
jgi:hypothetical protein